jgi:chemotaxis protein histidine kinase CheA
LRDQIEVLGGTITVHSLPAAGTELAVALPLER